jgi:protoporphyrinogen oxidase
MGLALLRLQLGRRGIAAYERQTASSWIRRNMGGAAWDRVWGPLMRGKFGERAEEISMGWIWDKVGKRRSLREGEARQERFIWPTGSFEVMFAELERRITAA